MSERTRVPTAGRYRRLRVLPCSGATGSGIGQGPLGQLENISGRPPRRQSDGPHVLELGLAAHGAVGQVGDLHTDLVTQDMHAAFLAWQSPPNDLGTPHAERRR